MADSVRCQVPSFLSFTLAGPPSPEDLKLFLDCSQGLELEIPGGEWSFFGPEVWSRCLELGIKDAEVRLLLVNLPELDELQLVLGQRPDPSWVFPRKMIQSPASWPHGRLSKLKKLRVNYDEDACVTSLARVSALFHLPSLLVFEAGGSLMKTCTIFKSGPDWWALRRSQPSNS